MVSSDTPRTFVVPPPPRRVREAVACLMVAASLGACRDAPTDPMVGLVAEESRAALALGVAMPDPAAWSPEGTLEGEAARALSAWQASWDLPADEGRRSREGAYGPLVRALADVLDTGALDRELALLSEGVRRAVEIAPADVPAHVSRGIASAAALRATAAEARARGDVEGTVDAVVRGGDALREVGPEAVARALQREVEERLGRVSQGDPYTDQDLERLGRLVQGGRQALEAGHFVLAIRRAYYAKGILDGNG